MRVLSILYRTFTYYCLSFSSCWLVACCFAIFKSVQRAQNFIYFLITWETSLKLACREDRSKAVFCLQGLKHLGLICAFFEEQTASSRSAATLMSLKLPLQELASVLSGRGSKADLRQVDTDMLLFLCQQQSGILISPKMVFHFLSVL